MNGDDEDVNLGLALGSANHRVQTKPSSSSGAGVNANLKVGMTFAASDAQSGLVWSPQSDFSLKFADTSFANKKPLLCWNVGPTNKVFPRYQSIGSMQAGDEVSNDDVILTLSPPELDDDCRLGNKGFGEVEGTFSPSFTEIEDSCKEKGQSGEGAHQVRETYSGQSGNACDSKSGNVEPGVAIFSASNAAQIFGDINARSLMEPDEKGTSSIERMNQGGTGFFNLSPPMMEVEASDENDLCNLTEKVVHSLGETGLPFEYSLHDERFPVNSIVGLHKEKGKKRALSNGGMHKRSSNDDDDSNESVESCNSVGLFSRGIERQNYGEELIVGSKRMKKQAQGNSGSSSMVRPHSSFMNWISNMVKGLSDSYKEESSALGLTHACSSAEYVKYDQGTFGFNKTRDSPSLTKGFQTMFQSLYCLDSKVPDTVSQEENYSCQESKEMMILGKTVPEYLADNNESSCKEIVILNKQMNTHISRDAVDQQINPWVLSSDLICTPYAYEANLAENRSAEKNLACKNATENVGSNFSLLTCDMPGKSSYLSSLWINRLSTRRPQIENCKLTSQRAIQCSIDFPDAILDNRANDVFSTEHNCLEPKSSYENCVCTSAKDIQKLATKPEASATCKLKPNLPYPQFGSSEAMASVFSKRLDALKHIKPSCSFTCFFCGESGHELRQCPNLTKTDLSNFPMNISSQKRIEETECLCIKCFQYDHWPISCPTVSSFWKSKQIISAIDHISTDLSQPWACNELHLGSTFINRTEQVNESFGISKSLGLHAENEMKDDKNKYFPFASFVTIQNIDVPVEISLAIRKLRLSRVDILRCMNSHISSLSLNGFFLRLRLGKLESGQGATDYCVARMIGDKPENIEFRSKKSILVDVGGIKSSIGSQYVSNQDFLENEIKAWWCGVLKTGSKIPTLDELNVKLKDRKRIGF